MKKKMESDIFGDTKPKESKADERPAVEVIEERM